MTRTLTLRAAVVCGTLAAAGCAATEFVSTWKAPDAQPLQSAGAKVAAVVVSKDVSSRRAAEDALARQISLQGSQGIPMYSILPDADPSNEAAARSAFEAAGIVGVVTMRPVRREKEVSSTPAMYAGPYYGPYWGGYYGYGWGAPWGGPVGGEIRTDTIVSVETLVYSIRQNKLVWAGQSKTTNPSGVDSLIKEIVDAGIKEMKKQGLL